jgi:myo-inositol-1(or 4)-monophosphatase
MLDHRELDELLALARRVTAEASALLRTADRSSMAIASKSNANDLVTEWDRRIEDLIRGRLHEETRDIPIVGEEAGTSMSSSASRPAGSTLRWLVDPVDGTVNFSHGLPFFGVTVALEEGGDPVVGVIAAPALGWEAWARRGGGAFAEDGTRLAVSRTDSLPHAMLATGFPYDRATSRGNFAAWDHFQCVARACRRIGAASLDLMMVARGWLDGYWESGIEAWDLSAGALLVREAGGRVTGITGEPFVSDQGHAVATNGAIHEVMLRDLATLRAAGHP